MKKLPSLARALAFVSLAALLVGCKTTRRRARSRAAFRSDYRQRHPIAVREGKQTLTVFIGDRRSGLTASQRAEVGALAPAWRREATGGFVIEVPYGTSNERAATGAAREIRAILAGSRRAAAIRSRCGPTAPTIRPGSARCASTIRGWWPRPAPADCGRTTSARPMTRCTTPTGHTGITAAPISAISPRRSTTPPISCSRAPRRPCSRRAARPRSTSTARAKPTATQYPDANKGKISDVGQ